MWRNRTWLILLFLLFFIPPVVAWLLVLGGWRPPGATHRGVLIQPPAAIAELPLTGSDGTPLEQSRFDGQWSLLLLVAGACDEACVYTLDRLVRVHISLNKDADRVQLLLVQPEGAAAPAELPRGLLTAQAPPAVLERLIIEDSTDAVPSAVQLVDPYGFRMMSYPAPLDAQGLLKDLRHLLRLSNEEIERLRRSEAHDG
jgi:hypothetical protein